VIDGTNLFPGTGYLMLVWQSLAANKNTPWKKLPVEFKDVRILSGTILSNENPVKFIVNVDNSSGQFYVRVGSDIACTGNVSVPREPILSLSCQYEEKMKNQNNLLSLESKDIYKTLRVHGYDFGPKFTGVMKATQDFNCIELRWTGEWISFADSMLHVLPYITGLKSRTILVPTFIESIKCDPRLLYGKIEAELNPEMSENEIKNFTIFYDKNLDAVFSNCLEFQGFQSIPIKRKDNLQGLCMEKYIFVTNNEVNMNDLENRSDRDREPCDTTLANILKEFNFEVKKYLNDEKVENLEENNNSINILRNEMYKFESKFSLNNFLKDIFNNNEIPDGKISFKQFVKIIEKKYSLLRSCDITSNLFADERLLRTQLDIILENHFSDKFSIFEYNDGHSNCLYKFIKNWLKYSPLFEIPFEYKLTNFGEQSFSDYDKEINFEEIHLNKSNTNFLNSMRDYDIVIVNCLSYQPNYEEFVLKLSNIIKEDGFLLIIIRTSLTIPEKFLIKLKNSKLPEPNNAEEMLRISSSVGFNVISTKCFSSSLTTVLLRKKYRIELNKSLILKIHSENFDWVNDLQSKIKELEDEQNDRKIWLIGNEPEIGIIGFINCLRKELKSDRIRCLFDMERSLPENLVELKKKINEISNSNLVFNVWRDGKLGTFRHLTLEKNLMTPLIKAKNYYLKILKRGDLNTLRWFEIPHEDYLETKHKQIPVKVYYATINDTDIDMIYNRSSIDPKLAKHEILLGKEFSGKIKHSDKRVMGIKFSGAISTELFTHEDLLFEIPNDWSLIESATVPFNYFICYYSLYLKGNLRENESVFIRIKDFCLSQAAISICLSRKCQIFVTVVNVHQEKILLDKFGLNSELIFIRENISIKNQILNLTNGRGVDLIFSCDEGYFDDCMHCLKNCGTYLELKKQRILDNQMLPSFEFRRNISFHSIDINYILRYFQYGIKPNPIWERQVKEVRDLFKKGLKNGEIKPFPQKIFKKDQFREAVQMNALDPNLNHKIIIEIQDEKDANSKSISIKATGRCSFNPRKTFIITGGLGGFGFELTKWLFERGARNIILTSRTGIKNNIQKYFIDYFNEKGGHVEVSNLDITSEKQAIHLIERAEKFGQIGGIFHLALVMKDGFFENQNSKQFHEVHIAKFNGLKNLDNITRSRNTDLDLFVAFSSISCGRGNPGQSNYGFSNSSVERLCEMRRKDGLHGLAIQWGPIDDVGVLIERSNKINEDLKHKGLVPQRMPTCFAVLDYVLNLPYAVVSSFTRGESVTEELKTEESLLEQLTVYLGLDYQKISDLATLEDIGVDSLMSLEVQKRLEREFEKSIPLASIKKITVGQLKAVSKRDKTDFLKILKL
jgi:fatty acid synthase